jgi:hypothetical protein
MECIEVEGIQYCPLGILNYVMTIHLSRSVK